MKILLCMRRTFRRGAILGAYPIRASSPRDTSIPTGPRTSLTAQCSWRRLSCFLEPHESDNTLVERSLPRMKTKNVYSTVGDPADVTWTATPRGDAGVGARGTPAPKKERAALPRM
jgi:hypothetical protein